MITLILIIFNMIIILIAIDLFIIAIEGTNWFTFIIVNIVYMIFIGITILEQI